MAPKHFFETALLQELLIKLYYLRASLKSEHGNFKIRNPKDIFGSREKTLSEFRHYRDLHMNTKLVLTHIIFKLYYIMLFACMRIRSNKMKIINFYEKSL